MQKLCTGCGLSKELNLENFPHRKTRWDSWCRQCYRDQTKRINLRDPEKKREADKEYRERTKDLRREFNRRRAEEYNRLEATKASRRKHHQMLKRNCFAAYSRGREIACECCNENILDFLTLDHERNDGKSHRDSLGGRRNGPRFYKWLEQQGYPQDLGLRVLCQNCNWARHWSPDKRCPHELARQELLSIPLKDSATYQVA